ncbi:MAG: FG-GAP repeat protein, partial [Candidatus Kerfeldbacteria bacterium]|nr:FG-GAP repeat protein [Candidatus Kerfeldbacteria bacterium]
MKRITTALATISLLVLPVSNISSEEIMPYEMDDGGGGGNGGQCSPRIVKDLGLDQPAGIIRAGSASPGFSAPQQALTGDVDGNGTADLIVTGPAAGVKRYVAVFFDATLSSLSSRSFSSADYKILSPKQYPWLGDVVKKHQMQWLAVGDVNNDQFDDIIFSMPTIYLGRDAQNNELRDDRGEVYVVLGNTRSNLGVVRDLATQPADFTFVGADDGDHAGFGLGTGDINADGRDDIIIGAPQADGPGNAFTDGGEAYAITSINFGQGSMALTQSNVNLYLYGEAGE